jgi:hypothetical protein
VRASNPNSKCSFEIVVANNVTYSCISAGIWRLRLSYGAPKDVCLRQPFRCDVFTQNGDVWLNPAKVRGSLQLMLEQYRVYCCIWPKNTLTESSTLRIWLCFYSQLWDIICLMVERYGQTQYLASRAAVSCVSPLSRAARRQSNSKPKLINWI